MNQLAVQRQSRPLLPELPQLLLDPAPVALVSVDQRQMKPRVSLPRFALIPRTSLRDGREHLMHREPPLPCDLQQSRGVHELP